MCPTKYYGVLPITAVILMPCTFVLASILSVHSGGFKAKDVPSLKHTHTELYNYSSETNQHSIAIQYTLKELSNAMIVIA